MVSCAAKARQEPGRRFAPYAVQVRARCAVPDLLRMLEAMENANPYVSMAGISVLADDAWPRQQSARVTIEWPRHVGPLDKALQDVLPQAVDAGRKAP